MIDLGVFEVAYVLAADKLVSFCKTERIFQIGSSGENILRATLSNHNRCGDISPRPPEQNRLLLDEMHDGIIDLPENFPVMH